MLSRTLVLLVTTILGSLAQHDLFNDRRSNYNTNTNMNQMLGGFGDGGGSDTDSGDGQVEVGTPKTIIFVKPNNAKKPELIYLPAKYRPSKSSNGYVSADDDAHEYISGYGFPDICDENSNSRVFHDEDDAEESRRSEIYHPYLRSGNVIGSKYRRTFDWRPFPSMYGSRPKYDQGHLSTNVNTNTNTNVFTGRRSNANSNINSNINTNDINYGRPQAGRRIKPTYRPQYAWANGETFAAQPPKRFTTQSPYAIAYRADDELDDDDNSPSEIDTDVNMNSNMNSNVNSRRSRIRRSLKNLSESNRDGKLSKGSSTVADNESV